jgi:hypothetical protein
METISGDLSEQYHHTLGRNPFNADWSRYVPIGGAGSVWYKNKTPYTMSLNVTFESWSD